MKQQQMKGVRFQSGGHGIVPVDHPMEHGEVDSTIFAFQSWMNGSTLQLSSLYEGDRALDFVDSHFESNTFAGLHIGGEEVREEYNQLQEQLEEERQKEMWG